MTVLSFRTSQLGLYQSHFLAKGGQGKVYTVPNAPPGLAGSFVYKEYLPAVPVDADALESVVGFLDTLGPGERTFLDGRSAWPVALVADGGRPLGFLMRQVPDEFRIAVGNQIRTQGMEFLLNDDAYLRSIGIHLDNRLRLQLLRDLAQITALLHREQAAIGDLSPKNVLFTLDGTPRCLLIDCDSMRVHGRSAVEPVDTPDWEVPAGESKATPYSDGYKFGLIAARLFDGDQSRVDYRALGAVSPDLAALARRSVESAPAGRPDLVSWFGPLDAALAVTPSAPVPSPVPAAPPQPQFQPPPAPPARRSPVGWVVAASVALVLLFAGIGKLASSGGTSAEVPASTSTTLPYEAPADPTTEPTTDEPTTEPTTDDGAVDVDTAQVDGDPGADEVAAMFGAFYGAINARDYDTALSYYDPATKAVDVHSTTERARWKKVMATTQESGVTLTALTDTDQYTEATVVFSSHQDAGYGPASDPGQTCTDWTVTYWLTHNGGHYRIFKAPSKGVSFSAC
ncbi:hypothetical protein [Streptomyces sp. NBC_01477]|uniref:hypothetical protein n=1 Tax=Streptomyces sp. NBC_01477 TaxID=2976015 RepID=UPI002E33FE34|nr:hypothetical protein [Streptomyces sp. NBC_01477]